METSSFFAHFPALADAPNGVQKLRELILKLAMQGKLVPQDASDEPATLLVSKNKPAIDELSKENGIPLRREIMESEFPYDLPTGWEWVRLGELVQFIGGSQPPKSTFIYEPRAGYTRLIQIRDFKSDDHPTYVPDNFANRPFTADDVMIGRYGPPVFQILRGLEGTYNVALMKAAPIEQVISKDFLFTLLQEPRIQQKVIAESERTAGQSGVRKELLHSFVIGLPPLAEQQRIVAKVDQLMALCDELEARQQRQQAARVKLNNAALEGLLTARAPAEFAEHWQRICDNFDLLYDAPATVAALRQAILQLAVQGKLVPQAPNDEPAAVLLAKIKAEKERLIQEKKIKKSEPLPIIQDDEIIHSIPNSWCWIRLADICELITDGTHQTPKYTTQGRIFLSAQNVKPFQFKPEDHKLVSEADYKEYVKSRKPEFEDILLTRVGAGIGEAAVIDREIDFAFYVSIALIRPIKLHVSPHYLTIWLNSPSGKLNSSLNTYGKGVSQGNLNLGLIRKFVVSLPPLAEQRRIVAKVDQLMALCDELEAKLRQAQTASAKLMTATVQHLAAA